MSYFISCPTFDVPDLMRTRKKYFKGTKTTMGHMMTRYGTRQKKIKNREESLRNMWYQMTQDTIWKKCYGHQL